MNTLKIYLLATICLAVVSPAFSQKVKTETFKVAGECGTCKKKIEKAARDAGATYAVWDTHSKILNVTYNAGIELSAIQQRIADAGYDTPKFRATDAAYNSLDKCCQYDRQVLKKAPSCCGSDECKMKDGKCADMTACKDKGCCKDDADCSKKACCEKTASIDKGGVAEKQ